MKDEAFESIYRDVPVDQRERLKEFHATHPYRQHTTAGVQWNYIASGEGQQAILILGGGLSVGETSFENILRLEKRYRVLSPSYPPVGNMRLIADGLASILDKEGIARAHVFGHSLGAGIAHVFVRLYPERVDKLILDGFGLYSPASFRMRVTKLLLKLPIALLKARYRSAIRRLLASADDDVRAFYQAYIEELLTKLHTDETLKGQFSLMLDIFDKAGEYGVFQPVERPGRVLLILAEDDRGFKPAEREAMIATYPGAQVHTFASGGHLSGFTHPEEFNWVLDDFLDTADGFRDAHRIGA